MKNNIRRTALIGAAVMSMLTLMPQGAYAEWRRDDTGWWYAEDSSYATGWRYIDGKWYYFYSDGYMASCYKIGDYFVNSNGEWTDEITSDEAFELICNEDRAYVNGLYDYGCVSEYEGLVNLFDASWTQGWDLPKEECYHFAFVDKDTGVGEPGYLVGIESKNVYSIPNQGGSMAYRIKDGQKAESYEWENKTSYDWRQD